MIAGLELAQQRRSHRRHARCGGAAGLGAFHDCDPFFQHPYRRILQAAVGHTVLLAGKTRGGIFGAVIAVAGSQEQRL